MIMSITTCPAPAEHRLHVLHLGEACPLCGGAEPLPVTDDEIALARMDDDGWGSTITTDVPAADPVRAWLEDPVRNPDPRPAIIRQYRANARAARQGARS
jgi:hypothetical protein